MNPPRPIFPFTIHWAISSREHWIWTGCGLLSKWQLSNRNYCKILNGSLESGPVIYVAFISFYSLLNQGLIGGRVSEFIVGYLKIYLEQ